MRCVPYKVLIIDDSRTMREVLKVYLMGGKYEFIEAESATRALDVLKLVPVDLIIADINLPRMDGITFLHHVKESNLPRLRSVPVILVTGDKSEELQDRLRGAHADAFLQKPLDAERLVEVVERLLHEKRT